MDPSAPQAPKMPMTLADLEKLAEHVASIESRLNTAIQNQNEIVSWLKSVDSIAFAALMLTGKKEFTLTKEASQETKSFVESVIAEMARQQKEIEAEQAEEAAKNAREEATAANQAAADAKAKVLTAETEKQSPDAVPTETPAPAEPEAPAQPDEPADAAPAEGTDGSTETAQQE